MCRNNVNANTTVYWTAFVSVRSFNQKTRTEVFVPEIEKKSTPLFIQTISINFSSPYFQTSLKRREKLFVNIEFPLHPLCNQTSAENLCWKRNAVELSS